MWNKFCGKPVKKNVLHRLCGKVVKTSNIAVDKKS
jgi:hypothetical protein